jgi:hypothetical protein
MRSLAYALLIVMICLTMLVFVADSALPQPWATSVCATRPYPCDNLGWFGIGTAAAAVLCLLEEAVSWLNRRSSRP